jgi:hypothetical protein
VCISLGALNVRSVVWNGRIIIKNDNSILVNVKVAYAGSEFLCCAVYVPCGIYGYDS